jgi:hypothetical protein
VTAFWPKGECSVNEQVGDLLQLGHGGSKSTWGPAAAGERAAAIRPLGATPGDDGAPTHGRRR